MFLCEICLGYESVRNRDTKMVIAFFFLSLCTKMSRYQESV